MQVDPRLLLILLAFVCFLTYWVTWAGRDGIGGPGPQVKTASTGLLAVVAFTDPARSFQLITLGLAFGALGDFALTRRSQTAFLLGMAAFVAGHLAYIAAFWLRAQTIADAMPPTAMPATAMPSTSTLAALIALAMLLLSTEVWLAPRTGALRWPVRGYVVVIGLMGMAALLLVPHPVTLGATYLQIGAALFILSDLLLALRLFVFPTGMTAHKLSIALWPAFWLGQTLIFFGAALYWLPFATTW
ncbi:lysoplasmalogenase [Cypionkella sp. TWP1-2-1b2]|uniref:lysoplasmalogenase n=1 Tax=Cypionkella sp. TWP1-2-1b2 TaxID=2804675 RepID=UPI003CFA8144